MLARLDRPLRPTVRPRLQRGSGRGYPLQSLLKLSRRIDAFTRWRASVWRG